MLRGWRLLESQIDKAYDCIKTRVRNTEGADIKIHFNGAWFNDIKTRIRVTEGSPTQKTCYILTQCRAD